MLEGALPTIPDWVDEQFRYAALPVDAVVEYRGSFYDLFVVDLTGLYQALAVVDPCGSVRD